MKNSTFWSLFINPFTRLGGWKAFFIGFTAMLATTIIGCLGNVTPAGLLYILTVKEVSIGTIFTCQLTILGVFVIAMYVVGLVSTRHVRFQDVLGIGTLAQSPMLLIVAASILLKPLLGSLLSFAKSGDVNDLHLFQSTDTILIAILGLAIVTINLIWFIALLYNGFRTLTDLKGIKGIAVFIVLVILCDMLSSFLIAFFTGGEINRFVFL